MRFLRAPVWSAAWLCGAIALAVITAMSCASTGERDPFSHTDDPAGTLIDPDAQADGLSIEPASATIEIKNGVAVTQAFKLVANNANGTKTDVTNGGAWAATNVQVGVFAASGLYVPNGSQGGLVHVSATYGGKKANADLIVKLHLQENPAGISTTDQAALIAATAPDTSVAWAYPYDGTVFPRGLLGPRLMWNNGGPTDAYYVHVTSPTFELESFTSAPPPSRFSFAPATWQKFVDSTAGAATIRVARLNGTKATVIANHSWTVSPASMRGTIYYWSNNVGRVLRIKPGASAPDDFSAGTFGSLPASDCTMTCHTVSADGSTLVSGGDTMGGTYNLLTNTPIFDTDTVNAGPGSGAKRAWALAAISPNGKYIIENAYPGLPGPPGGGDGIAYAADGKRVPATGLEGLHFGMPTFSADGSKIAYIDIASGALATYDFDLATAKAGVNRVLVVPGTSPKPSWPSVSPDAKWIIYQRGATDTRFGSADLYLANALVPNQEIRLGHLDGDGYPFAAGTRDVSWNFEATFAPVASGGYFWVVFTSRRTYGNELVGSKDDVKQLWVAAIDQNPTAGVDPSHPPFQLPGQGASLNMRGFWALDPCKGDGQGCTSGTECCGGYCDSDAPGGALTCRPLGGCARDGDHCNASSDCCDFSSGSTCINHTCSEPAPK